MTTQKKIARIFNTRIGTRPGHPKYGSRMYLLRDKRADGEAAVWFAKYAHEDVQRSEPDLVVTEAKLVAIVGNTVRGVVKLYDNSEVPVEVRL